MPNNIDAQREVKRAAARKRYEKLSSVVQTSRGNEPYKCPKCKEEFGKWVVYQSFDTVEEELTGFPSIGVKMALCRRHNV